MNNFAWKQFFTEREFSTLIFFSSFSQNEWKSRAKDSAKMFKNLKNKIQEETGQDPITLPYRDIRTRNSISSHNSLSIDELSKIEEVRDFRKKVDHVVILILERCWDQRVEAWAGEL